MNINNKQIENFYDNNEKYYSFEEKSDIYNNDLQYFCSWICSNINKVKIEQEFSQKYLELYNKFKKIKEIKLIIQIKNEKIINSYNLIENNELFDKNTIIQEFKKILDKNNIYKITININGEINQKELNKSNNENKKEIENKEKKEILNKQEDLNKKEEKENIQKIIKNNQKINNMIFDQYKKTQKEINKQQKIFDKYLKF